MLVVNNLRDRETDGAAGKRTLAVRFGDRFTVIQYFVCLALAALTCAIGVSAMGWSRWTLLSLAGIAASAPAWVRVAPFLRPGAGDGAWGSADRRTLNPALAMTARGLAVYGAGLGIGALVGSLGLFGAS